MLGGGGSAQLRLTFCTYPPHAPPMPRSFQGFTCLIQISSRSHDYVVDALALRPFLGPALRPLLADPSRVKVLHGADRDVEWLQVGGASVSSITRVAPFGFGTIHLQKENRGGPSV